LQERNKEIEMTEHVSAGPAGKKDKDYYVKLLHWAIWNVFASVDPDEMAESEEWKFKLDKSDIAKVPWDTPDYLASSAKGLIRTDYGAYKDTEMTKGATMWFLYPKTMTEAEVKRYADILARYDYSSIYSEKDLEKASQEEYAWIGQMEWQNFEKAGGKVIYAYDRIGSALGEWFGYEVFMDDDKVIYLV